MRFNKLDLNLLVALDALLAERNISRAGERIHLSQPAMSNALARLRDYFGDELLIPHGRQLILSSRAQELIEPVREVLMRIDSTIATQPVFDPAQAHRKFVLFLSDYTTAVFVPALVERLYREAPGISLELKTLVGRPLDQLEQNTVDLLIIPSQYVSDDHPSSPLFEDEYLCVTWQGNRRIRDALTFDDYLSCPHVATNFTGTTQIPAFDGWFLERYGVKRRVEISTPSLTQVAHLVVGTDRIATVHQRVALQAAKVLPVALWKPPLEIPTLVQTIQWHKHRNNDPALRWLRETAIDVGRSI